MDTDNNNNNIQQQQDDNTQTTSTQEYRKVPIPSHRMTPLKENWLKVCSPLVQHLKLQVRMNLKQRAVELRSSPETSDPAHVQRGADFVRAFALGFALEDALALVRLDDLFVDTFDVHEVRELRGDHYARAIGRVAGKNGKTKFAIENTTRTRIVLADSRVHILGSYENIKLARDSIIKLIMGSPPGKVYAHLRNVASRLKERAH